MKEEKSNQVYFNGILYTRYPYSKNISDRNYFKGRKKGCQDKSYLHRDIWEYYNGKIPEGFHIHHKDGNPLNNNISNLECLEGKQHLSSHYFAMDEQIKQHKTNILLTVAQEKAKIWHGSEEGLQWHREQAKKSMFGEERTITCKECSNEFKTTFKMKRVCYCSRRCKSRFNARILRQKLKAA